MSGRLIILPKKSWHVWRQDNLERVLRDERLAAESKEEEQIKQRKADSEKRIEILRRRRGDSNRRRRCDKEDEKKDGGLNQGWGSADGHVNLFSNFEKKSGGNAEYTEEKKKEELRKQRSDGAAPVKFGAVNNESSADLWYLKSSSSIYKGSASKDSSSASAKKLRKKHKNDRSEQKKDRKKDKKKSKKTDNKEKCRGTSETMDELRKRRLERERESNSREKGLLKFQGELSHTAHDATPLPSERSMFYSSQFNPHKARQNWRGSSHAN